MTNGSGNSSSKMTDYTRALAAWDLAAGEWLGLDPEQVFRFRADVRDPYSVEASWHSIVEQRPRLGYYTRGAYSDGDGFYFTGSVGLDGLDSETFVKAIGPKPELFTPQEADRIRQLF